MTPWALFLYVLAFGFGLIVVTLVAAVIYWVIVGAVQDGDK